MGEIEKLAKLSLEPLMDPWLEGLNSSRLPYYRFLFHLARKFQPQACLELGVDGGIGSAHMAAAAHQYGGLVVGVDKRDCRSDTEFVAAKFHNYRCLWAESLTAIPVAIDVLGGRDIGLVFQDSGHHYVPSRLEWEYYQPLLGASFIWICDDVTEAFRTEDEMKSMADYFEGLPGRKWTFDFLHPGSVIGVVLP